MKSTIVIQDLMQQTGVRFGTSGIRGLVESMDDALCYAYTRAFLQSVVGNCTQVLVGHDLRPSSPRIAAACAAAIADSGARVVYAGVLPTPALAWYSLKNQMPAIMVTGSHIPFDRNGIKFYRHDGEITKADEAAITSARVECAPGAPPGTLPACDNAVLQEYQNRYLRFFEPAALAGLRIAVYEHSSAARDVLRALLEALGASVISLGRTDHFVPIDTEAVSAADTLLAQNWAREIGFDAILSTDGDADRPLIGDAQGNWLRGDVVGILCARGLGATRVVTPVSSISSVEACGSFAEVVRTRIGSPFVIAAMQERSAAPDARTVGFEANGGFLLGCDIAQGPRTLGALPTRDAVLPMLTLLASAKAQGRSLAELCAQLPQRFSTSDRLQNFAPEHSARLITTLGADLQAAARLLAPQSGTLRHVNSTDGFRASFDNGDIVHIRPSGNAPELRCYAESASPARAAKLCADCLAQLAASV